MHSVEQNDVRLLGLAIFCLLCVWLLVVPGKPERREHDEAQAGANGTRVVGPCGAEEAGVLFQASVEGH